MLDGMFVYDCSVHVYDLSQANMLTTRNAKAARKHIASFGELTMHGLEALGRKPDGDDVDFTKRWTVEELYDQLFVKATTDVAMAQVVPLYDWFNDCFAPVDAQHAFAERYPDRVYFCGGVDPNFQGKGLAFALDEIDRQAEGLGAVSFKFYNAHVTDSWRCDDEKIAYPMYEKIQQHGINTVQFHKGVPLGDQQLEALSPIDIQKAARDFPDLNFVIHHLATPPISYFHEATAIASRFDNVYLGASGNLNNWIFQPRFIEEQIGQILRDVGSHKLVWASEAALAGPPSVFHKVFLDFKISEDLMEGYGYPQITREDKENILGLNFARLMGLDVKQKLAELSAGAELSGSGSQ